ncbi:MAG: restriction endonuclease subunit S [Propionivibrio sp.]|uniref:restriction endonuclease subunit S n=1 Tax=Propionivibrio sp. TaxID=2212460 RepID=UPI001B42941B|nr:restriction endonuclease subunit S [Propionivibrio sp.]MBP7204285.1 restriction endonuclease subunit S [Propionivibrio sp.]MBP8215414.1 restriction endonuclease subunit S [Propionivibrio sp.]
MSWQEVQLGDGIHVKHGFAFKGEYFSASGEYLVLTPGNFLEKGGFRVRDGKERFYHADFPQDYLLSEDDLIVAMTEQGEGLLGSAARIPAEGKYLHNQRLGLVQIADPGLVDKRFLYWVFNSADVRAQIRSTATGAKVKHTAPERIKKVRLKMPGLSGQKAIASVLDSYDDLIATNQRRIALLEDAARRLYREWFVHLLFPGHESVPVKNGVSEGWQSLPLTSVADFINGFAFKPEHLQDTGLPVVKIPELRDGISSKTPRNVGTAVPPRNHIDTGDVLFSWSATLLVNEWGEGPALLNQHLFKVVPKNLAHKRLIRFAVEAAIPQLLGQSVGATMQHIRRGALDAYLMLVPDQAVANEFAALVDPMMDMVSNLQRQNRHLTSARDSLLPKLMSGQLDVSGIRLPEKVAA